MNYGMEERNGGKEDNERKDGIKVRRKQKKGR